MYIGRLPGRLTYCKLLGRFPWIVSLLAEMGDSISGVPAVVRHMTCERMHRMKCCMKHGTPIHLTVKKIIYRCTSSRFQ